jgi:Carboxypeptidase regulatory-like domain
MYSERGIFAPAGIHSRYPQYRKNFFFAAIILALVAPRALWATDAQWTFELAVVGPDSKPIPNASIDFRTSPAPTAEQVAIGKFSKKANYGSLVTTDESGVLKVNLSQPPKQLSLFIITPGYGPYAARWSPNDTGQTIPGKFTAELEAGWSVGGIMVDADGQPVEGVKIRPGIEFRKPPDDHSQLAMGNTVTSDKEGRWRFDSVPDSLHEIRIDFDHSAFKSDSKSLSMAEFAIQHETMPTAKIVLDRGIVVTGKITDEGGTPIGGALVRTRNREAKTGDDGTYRLSGCNAGKARIVVTAKGKAFEMKDLPLGEKMEPVDFQMKPGGTIRIRVVDSEGKPAPRSRIFFQKWKGEQIQYWEFDKINQYADKDGVWEWHEAPLDPLEADICPPNGMQIPDQPLAARDEEYVFKGFPTLVISGNVVDADTKTPIKSFKVIPGIRFSEDRGVYWEVEHSFTAANGKFQLKHDREYFAFGVQIQAEDYLPAASRDIISDEGRVSLDFELKRGGRPVVAKLEVPKDFKGDINWQFAVVEIQPYIPDVPPPSAPPVPADIAADPAKTQAWINNWAQTTDAGKTWMFLQRGFESDRRHKEMDLRLTGTVDGDGKLHIPSVPEGNYALSVRFDHGSGPGRIHEHHIAIPAVEAGKSDQELDLGVLKLDSN